MQEYPSKHIITVDDDSIYDPNLVVDLYNSYKIYKYCVLARRVNKITDCNNIINPYKNWKWEIRNINYPRFDLLATGCGGIFYPAHILPEETFDIENIKKYCLDTDDIWLKFMELKNNIPVKFVYSKISHPLTIRKSQKTALMSTNTKNQNINDVNIKKMEQFTGIKLINYMENANERITK